jgi:hypothetical protein
VNWKRKCQVVAAYLGGAAALALALRIAWVAFARLPSASPWSIGASLLLVILAFGMLRRNALALRAAAWVCVVAGVVLVGAFTPFAAGDYIRNGEEPPSVALFFVGEAAVLALAYFLHLRLPAEREA